MALAFLTLLSGLAISAVAIYYSVIGLAAIFSAAVIPIMVMGAILEVSKLVAAWWLKANWHRAPMLLKSYMLVAVIVLMLITSMGIFGFLSKAHTDQAIVTGDVQAQVYLIDEQIKVERENIANAQSLIKQLDDAVVGINASGADREIRLRDGTTRVQSAAERALQVRRSQAKDRANLTSQIEEAQQKILVLQEKKAPIAANMREVEAKVGPIKYIAQLIYGQDPDENLLEKAVTWVIITIVFVFDPLAVLLLLASQMSFQWARQEKERKDELDQEAAPPIYEPNASPSYEADDGPLTEKQIEQILESVPDADTGNKKIAEIEKEEIIYIYEETPDAVTNDNDNNASSVDRDVVIRNDQSPTVLDGDVRLDEQYEDLDEDEDYQGKSESIEKRAIHRWKAENSQGNIKRNRRLLDEGFITELPWQHYIDDEIKKIVDPYANSVTVPDRIKPDLTEIVQKDGYIQNSEQGESTIWKKIQEQKNDGKN
jgi:hypothetical protein